MKFFKECGQVCTHDVTQLFSIVGHGNSSIFFFIFVAMGTGSKLLRSAVITLFDDRLEVMLEQLESTVNNLPVSLLHPENECDADSFRCFIDGNDAYTNDMEKRARELLFIGVDSTLSHRSFHHISATLNLSSVIGMDVSNFMKLFAFIESKMSMAFSHSKSVASENDSSRNFCDNRFRLFTVLYRLKLASSFSCMEVIFGWCKSNLQEWFDVIIQILDESLHPMHVGIMESNGHANKVWQQKKAMAWMQHHEQQQTHLLFEDRLQEHNRIKRRIPSNESNVILGCIGAVDCTYSIRCRVSDRRYQEQILRTRTSVNTDTCYSEHIKHHAYKLSLITSHKYGDGQKLILDVAVCLEAGTTSDSSVFQWWYVVTFSIYDYCSLMYLK